ncbi:MAG: hypothetical protein AAGA48_11110 [Myxococcota bacterium]
MRLLVSMGVRPQGRVGEPLRPLLCEVDADRGCVLRRQPIEVVQHGHDGIDQELTSACRGPDGQLWQAAHTEVLRIDPQTLDVTARWSHPSFHNVHSVIAAPDQDLVVTATSTDRVLKLDATGRLIHTWSLAPRELPRGDLRGLDHNAFKPHRCHPNHAEFVGDTLWVTRFATRDCRSLPGDRIIALPEAMPHDGRLRGGWLWFTQVTGRVVAVDPHTLARKVDLDLQALTGESRMLGWCRGIDVVGDRVFVGFSMLRRPRHREVLRLLWRGLRGHKLPTRVLELDWRAQRVVRETVLGNAAGGTIYAVTAYPDNA